MTDETDVATVDQSLRLGGGVHDSDRDLILDRWASLDNRLRSFRAGSVELQLTVKERDTPSQRTTLEAWITGQQRLVATSDEASFQRALTEVRDDLIRQLTDAKNRTEPRNNRHLR
jgi:ribosome-associated translation inhibitor RaiA